MTIKTLSENGVKRPSVFHWTSSFKLNHVYCEGNYSITSVSHDHKPFSPIELPQSLEIYRSLTRHPFVFQELLNYYREKEKLTDKFDSSMSIASHLIEMQ